MRRAESRNRYVDSRRIRAGVLTCAVFVLGGCGRHSDPAKPVPGEVNSKLRPEWTVGQKYSYAVKLTSHAGTKGAAEVTKIDLTVDLDVSPFESNSESSRARFSLKNLKLVSIVPKAPDDFPSELAKDYAVTIESGRIRELDVVNGTSPLALGIERAIASAFEVAVKPGSTWTATEVDATGTYTAEYRQADEPGRYSKHKVRYEPLPTTGPSALLGGLKLVPKVRSSTGEVRVGDGTLQLVRLHDELSVPASAGVSLDSSTELEVSLTKRDSAPADPGWVATRAALVPAGENRARLGGGVDKSFDQLRIDGLTFDGVVQALEAEPTDDAASQGTPRKATDADATETDGAKRQALQSRSRYFTALSALLRQDPKNVPKAVERIRRNSPATIVLLDALAASGDASAQAGLVTMVRDAKMTPMLRQSAAFSLIRTQAATEATVRALIELMDDPAVGAFAVYGLGTAARRLRESNQAPLALVATQALLNRLGHVKGGRLIDVLRGISNSGYSGALPAVRPYLADKDPALRGAAVEAVRLMDDPTVDGVIAHALQDQDESMRLSALNAAKTRAPSEVLATGLDKIARSDEAVRCRERAVQLIGRWVTARPELRATLQYVAEHDGRDAVRAAAQGGLAVPASQGG